MLQLVRAAAGSRRSRVLNRQTSHAPQTRSVLGTASGSRAALDLPLAVALVDTPHSAPRPRAACFLLLSATRVLVLTEGPLWHKPRLPHPTSNSQPQEQSFLCSFVWHVLSPQKSRPPGLDVDSAQAGWYLLMWKVLYLGLRPGSGTGSRLRA
jgi:hypothetical protein